MYKNNKNKDKYRFLVTVKHYTPEFDSYMHPIYGTKVYDRDEEYIFTYTLSNKELNVEGGSWQKTNVETYNLVDTIKSFFHGQCYDLANIEELLN